MRGAWQLAMIGAVLLVVIIGVPAMIWGPGYLRVRQEARVRAEGLPASAVIIGLEDTGNRFNDTPEIRVLLELSAQGRPPWRASVVRILSVAEVHAFAPGRSLSARYDPAHPDRVALVP